LPLHHPTPDARFPTTDLLHRLLPVALGVLFALLSGSADAQLNSNQLQQRYKKNTGNSSIEDGARQLNSADADERLEAVRSLGATRDQKAVEYLIQAMGDSDLRVQAKSVETLGELRATDATQVLIQHLFLRSTEPQMKQRILAALGKIGDPRAARPIMEFLQRDLDPATRGTAIYALGDIGAAESVETLQTIATNDHDATAQRLANEAINKVRHFQANKQKEAKAPTDVFLPKPPQQPEAQ
jgi:HEAT repeat protein